MFSRPDAADMREYSGAGLSLDQIASLFGTTRYTVRRVFAMMGYIVSKGRPSVIDDRKICTRCGRCKLLEDFQRDRSRADGHSFICKKCINRARRLRPENQ